MSAALHAHEVVHAWPCVNLTEGEYAGRARARHCLRTRLFMPPPVCDATTPREPHRSPLRGALPPPVPRRLAAWTRPADGRSRTRRRVATARSSPMRTCSGGRQRDRLTRPISNREVAACPTATLRGAAALRTRRRPRLPPSPRLRSTARPRPFHRPAPPMRPTLTRTSLDLV